MKSNKTEMIESGMIGPNIFNYTIQKNEFLAKETDLCQAFHQLQKVSASQAPPYRIDEVL